MPITSASNGVRPEYRALSVINVGSPVTPDAINECVGTGKYASKYVTLLKRVGFVFTTEKDGKTIKTYTLISEPENASEYRNATPKVKAVKPSKVAKPKKVLKGKRAASVEALKERNRQLIAKVAGIKLTPKTKSPKAKPERPHKVDVVGENLQIEEMDTPVEELVRSFVPMNRGPALVEEYAQ